MKSQREIIKILAETITENYYEPNINDADRCRFCGCSLNTKITKHSADCPVLLAEEVLKEEEPLHIGDKVTILCSGSEGTIRSELNIHNKYDVEIDHNSTFHMFYKRKELQLKKRKLEKLKEPLIVHNVLKYKGEYYLKQLGGCTDCSFHGILCHNDIDIIKFGYQTKCIDTNTVWKSFKDIQITDELASMSKDIGDVYLKGALNTLLILQRVRMIENVPKVIIYIPKNPIDMRIQLTKIDHLRLATAEEIQEYLNK